MCTLLLDVEPEIAAWLARRRACGQDGRDEMWEGVYHLAPHEHARNGAVAARLVLWLHAAAQAAGLVAGGAFHLGEEGDFRVPDLGFHRVPVTYQLYMPTAALVIEVLSVGDETFAKFDFYAAHDVEEIWVADPAARSLRCWQREGRTYRQVERSELLGLAMADLTAGFDWP